MKSFKEYLVENKQVYEFKIKIAGDCPKDCTTLIKRGLSKFHVESCSGGKSTPIQETQAEFPNAKNVSVTVFDVTTSYPATSLEVAALVAEHCSISQAMVKVRNLKEQEEEELNHANDEASGESLLEKPQLEDTDGQKLVGEKHTMSLLKELSKKKVELSQYKGINEKLLAKKVPAEKIAPPKVDKKAAKSVVGSHKVTLPSAGKGK